jgi:hypothetical protein
MKKTFLTVQHYAEKYNLSRQRIYQLIGEGKIPKEAIELVPREPTIYILDKKWAKGRECAGRPKTNKNPAERNFERLAKSHRQGLTT